MLPETFPEIPDRDPSQKQGELDAAVIDLTDPANVDRLIHRLPPEKAQELISLANRLEEKGTIASKYDFLLSVAANERIEERHAQLDTLEEMLAATAFSATEILGETA